MNGVLIYLIVIYGKIKQNHDAHKSFTDQGPSTNKAQKAEKLTIIRVLKHLCKKVKLHTYFVFCILLTLKQLILSTKTVFITIKSEEKKTPKKCSVRFSLGF